MAGRKGSEGTQFKPGQSGNPGGRPKCWISPELSHLISPKVSHPISPN
jgi:hypothetical protein